MISNYLIKALANCEKALENLDENQSQWEMNCRKVGNILQSMGWFEEALLWHSRLLENEHNLVQIYQDLALLYSNLEKWDEAINSYKKMLEFETDTQAIYFQLSKIYGYLGNKEQETECLFQISISQPDKVKPQGFHKLGKIFQELGKNEQAITCYLSSLEKEPQLLETYYSLGEIYVRENDWEKAINTFEQLLKQDQRQALGYYNIGQIWWQQENYSQAISYFAKAAFLEPKLAQSYYNFAIILNQKGKFDEVIKFCRALIGSNIINVWSYIQMGNALVKKGQLTEASLCYQQGAKLRGWEDCVKKNYQFTKDFFNYKIEIFKIFLSHLVNQPSINGLEINCQEGMSTCWLLDNILTESTAKITCLDYKFSDLFNLNIEKTEHKNKVTLLEGDYLTHLKSLNESTPLFFDLINIQYLGNTPSLVQKITEHCWQLTKKGGLIIFNINWSNQNSNSEELIQKQEIGTFLTTKENQLNILYQNQQLIIRKMN